MPSASICPPLSSRILQPSCLPTQMFHQLREKKNIINFLFSITEPEWETTPVRHCKTVASCSKHRSTEIVIPCGNRPSCSNHVFLQQPPLRSSSRSYSAAATAAATEKPTLFRGNQRLSAAPLQHESSFRRVRSICSIFAASAASLRSLPL